MGGHDYAIGKTFDVARPDVLTHRTMIETVARLLGKRRLILEVPFLTPRLSSYWAIARLLEL